jgi:omega-6 fatty acid desaturase (delta-12 desaturase)
MEEAPYMAQVSASRSESRKPAWQTIVARYTTPDLRLSVWQLCNSLIPYLVLWYLMYLSLSYSYWITLALSVVASGFLLRCFIIFHDCTHGAFFKSRKANDVVGIILGLLSFTPYYEWRHRHALHHATTSDLDRRGWWDIDTLTVREYLALPKWKQLRYRLYRNPIILFGLGSSLFFLVIQRWPAPGDRARERNSVIGTNFAIAGMIAGMSALIGFENYLLIQLPIAFISSALGLWMFYVQHQFEEGYWAPHEEWDYVTASLQGSSYYKLPRILQWFTGNIGYHHIHHLSSKIPNYRLQACFEENEMFREVNTLTFWSSLQAVTANLWDEEQKKMISFGQLKKLQLQPAQQV